jgi:hypothetical protein
MALTEFQDQDQSLALWQAHHKFTINAVWREKDKSEKVVLGDRLQDKVNKEIVEAAETVGVELPTGVSEFHFLIKEGQYHGSKMIRTRSIDNYKIHYKQLWVFLAYRGL